MVLYIHSLFKKLREKIKDKDYFKKLIEKYFINNEHLIKLTFYPDPNLEMQEKEKEKETLKKIKESLSSEEKKNILFETQELANFQKVQENQSLECLPKLAEEDIPEKTKEYPLLQENHVYIHPCFTNKILYTNLVFDINSTISPFLLSLFSSYLFEMGNKKRSYNENLAYIHKNIGEINAHVSIHTPIQTKKSSFLTFNIYGKALYRKNSRIIFFNQRYNF